MTIGDLTHVSCHPSGSELVKPLAPAGLGVAGRASLTLELLVFDEARESLTKERIGIFRLVLGMAQTG